MRATILVDLGFGDAGKGLLTDALVRKRNAGLVIRYNGGAQAGHNVHTADGRQHTFSQFGSGTFVPGVKTWLSQYVVLHPSALLLEGDLLAAKGERDAFSRLKIDPRAVVITPYHQAANRILELSRGERRHGSCGVGIGQAVRDSLAFPEESVRAGDLADEETLRQKLKAIRARKIDEIHYLLSLHLVNPEEFEDWAVFSDERIQTDWLQSISRVQALGLVGSEDDLQSWLSATDEVIFEGAQGVLLDADHGFHPHTTWSDCTTRNARQLVEQWLPQAGVRTIGLTRAYMVRHGPGPLPTATRELFAAVTDDNRSNAWQGGVRYGWFDPILLNYALAVNGPVDELAVTHLDVLERIPGWKYCAAYDLIDPTAVEKKTRFDLAKSERLTFPQREAVTKTLMKVKPHLSSLAPEREQVIHKIEELLGARVGIQASGNTAANVSID